MQFLYPAIVKEVENGYHVRFPDLEMCEAFGEDLHEALHNARDAMEGWIRAELEEDEPVFPPLSDEEDMVLEEGEFVRNVLVIYRFYDGWDE